MPGPVIAKAKVCWVFDEEEMGSLNVEIDDDVLNLMLVSLGH